MSSQRIDRYELRGLLGRGAMGRVYGAWDGKLEREVALKLVSRNADRKARERFQREVWAIAALRHPNIVEIYDYSGPDAEHLYYVMEKLEGDDLFNLVHANGPMPEPAVAAVGHELCLALEVMHEAGIIHRDLKPENVFLDAQGRVVLTDFGVVKALREGSALGGVDDRAEVVGTPGFMAPELLEQRPLGAYTDIFALGALLYNLMTGELPYAGISPAETHRAILAGAIVDLGDRVPGASEAMVYALGRCLSAKAKDRPQSAGGLRPELKLVLDAYGVSDLRDELSAYMRNPAVYAEAARQRGVRRLVRELAGAIEGGERAQVARLERRLLDADPDGSESRAMEDVIEAARARAEEQPSGRTRRWLAGAVGVLGVASLVAALGMGEGRAFVERMLGPRRSFTRALSGTAATGAGAGDRAGSAGRGAGGGSELAARAAPASAVLEVQLNGKAAVTIGGERVEGRELRGKRLPPGRYRVEVVAGRKRLALEVDLVHGKRVVVSADLKRGRIQTQ